MKQRLLLCILILGILLPQNITAQEPESQEDLAPYLYYYSDYLNAFVVERADGTDSRIVAQVSEPRPRFTRPNGYWQDFYVNDIGWSESGEWLAWMVYNNHRYSLEAVHVSGTSHLNVLSWIESDLGQWSPAQDYLAVWGQSLDPRIFPQGLSLCNRTLWIVDASRDEFVSPVSYNLPLELPTMDDLCHAQFEQLLWSPDGQSLVLVYQANDYTDGIHTSTTTHIKITLDTQSTTYMTFPKIECGSISEKGWFLHEQNGAILAENTFSGVQMAFPAITSATLCEYTRHEFDQNKATLQKHPKPLIQPNSYPYYQIEWSPNDEWALASNDNRIYTVEGDNLTPLILFKDDAGYNPAWKWLTLDKVAIVQDYGEYLIFSTYVHSTNTLINHEISLADLSYEYRMSYSNIQLTPDEAYLIWMGEAPVVYDIQAKTLRLYRPDYDAFWSSSGGAINLHPDGIWAIITDEGLVSSGGGGKNHMGVIRVDMDYQRDLPTPMFGSAKWLPSNVNPDLLPAPSAIPLVPQPVRIVDAGLWSIDLIWKEDSQALAYRRHYLWEIEEDIFIWDLNTNTSQSAFISADYNQKLVWNEQQLTTTKRPSFRTWSGFDVSAISPNGQLGVLRSGDVYHIAGQLVVDLENYYIESASFSPDGHYLAIAGYYDENRVTIFDTQTWEIVGRLPHNATSLAFSPDGKYLAVSASWEILIYEVKPLVDGQ